MTNKSWFNCRVRYQRLDESGAEVKATDQFLLDGYSYTEAETRITMIMNEMINGAFQVINITKANYAEVAFFEGFEKWFRIKVSLITYDEESGKEKTSNQNILLTAEDVRDAYDKTAELMKGSISTFVIPSVNYTKILDVFPLSAEEELRSEMAEKGYKPVSEQVEEATKFQVEEGAVEEETAPETEELEMAGVDEETGEIVEKKPAKKKKK